MTLNNISQGIYVKDNIDEIAKDIDIIVFDCDGVLIDITESYDQTIKKTTSYILKEIANISEETPITFEIIDAFKETGGFNDEVDLTYAAILSLAAAYKLNKSGNEFIFKVIKNADQTGIVSVEKYIDSLDIDISDIRKALNYPGDRSTSLLYSIFDQLFYGPELYNKLFNKESKFTESGLIENDNVLLNIDLITTLKKKFSNKLAIVSGRGIESIRYSLKNLLEEFNLPCSMFLEDETRELAKPNPESLIRSICNLDSSHCLFVGDSMEDFIMAKEATKMGHKTTFCGIIGTSKHSDEKLRFFEERSASIILDSIDLLPNVLNLE